MSAPFTSDVVSQDELDLLAYLTDDELEDISLEFHVRIAMNDHDLLRGRWEYWMDVARKRRRDQGTTPTQA